MALLDKVKILAVDDLPEKLLVYQSILEELGEEVHTARSGDEALRHVLRHDFAVILLDVYMPGMDGFEAAGLIRKRKRSAHTPIIFITSFADEVRAAQGYAAGAVDYILAPVVPEVLRAKVKVFVDLFRMAEQLKRQATEREALAEERAKRAAVEDSNQRLRFLARACDVLGQSLDDEVTARDLARLPVPFLADLAAVALPPLRPSASAGAGQGGGPVGRLIVAEAEEGQAALHEQAGPDRLPAELAAAVRRILAGGPAEFLPEPPAPVGETATAGLVLPLVARGRVRAALALSRAASGRRFGPAELSMAETLASRAAVALDNALLYREVREADRQKNDFLSMLAHELRNPLAPIRNAVQMLRVPGVVGQQADWARNVIDRQVKHLVRLVDDLLDVSRITRGKIRLSVEPLEVAAVVAQALEAARPLLEERRHRLDVDLGPGPLWVNGDAVRLAQVLTNLLNNAAKYTDEGGAIRLTAAREAGQVVLRVRDNGVGIPAEMLASIFDLFAQVDRSLDRSQGGLGVGLTLVRRLVELHGGRVEAHSPGLGQGSEFVVRLPELVREGPGEARRNNAEPEHLPRGHRVLVVDDNVDGADSLAVLLRLGGCEVRVAHDGPAALEAARVFHPEVVMLDIGLPGMDGYEVARRLRQEAATEEAALVAVTGYGQAEDRARARQAGFDHYLLKPVDLEALQQVFASVRGPAVDRPDQDA